MSLYNAINGVNPATFFILPMLGHHPDYYPRFRDCFLSNNAQFIEVYTRVGGNNRNCGFGEEKLYSHPNFVRTYDDDYDSTYGWYIFSIPEKWKSDLDAIVEGRQFSEEYLNHIISIYPSLKDKITKFYYKLEA